MNWEVFYLVCFFLGFALSLISFVAGGFHLHLPTKFHFHFGHHAGIPHGTHAGLGDISVFNTFTLMAFLAWFGGMGYLLTRYSAVSVWLAFVFAAITGLLGACIVFLFLAKVLMPHDRAINQADYDMIGVLGRVNSSIRFGGTGEIVFTLEGTRRSCGARTEDGSAMEKGKEVVVTRYERGIAYVRSWDELTDPKPAAPEVKQEFPKRDRVV
jgi:membrane protein implicated in regulation of membrane protease activity